MGTSDQASSGDRQQPAADAPPGDAQSVPVPHDVALEGSSEGFTAVEGVRKHPEEPAPDESNAGGRTF